MSVCVDVLLDTIPVTAGTDAATHTKKLPPTSHTTSKTVDVVGEKWFLYTLWYITSR